MTMNLAGIEASTLDAQSLMLVRMAALVAVDAPPVSYMLNLQMAGEVSVDAEQVEGMLAAIAPIVGSARVASAASKIPCARDRARPSPSSTRAEHRARGAAPPARQEGRRYLSARPGASLSHPPPPRGSRGILLRGTFCHRRRPAWIPA